MSKEHQHRGLQHPLTDEQKNQALEKRLQELEDRVEKLEGKN